MHDELPLEEPSPGRDPGDSTVGYDLEPEPEAPALPGSCVLRRDVEDIAKIRKMAWQRSPANLLALTERLQVILLTEDVPRRRRRVYRSIIDYFEDVLEERIAKDDETDGEQVRRSAGAYLREILKTLEK